MNARMNRGLREQANQPEEQAGRKAEMTLLDLCEPLFDYLCQLNRWAAWGAVPPYKEVRENIVELFDSIKRVADGNKSLIRSYSEVELPLVFSVDHIISEGNYGEVTTNWRENRLAFNWRAEKHRTGDSNFFTRLDDMLNDQSQSAIEKLKVMRVCMGLGMAGVFKRDPEQARRKMKEVIERLGAERTLTNDHITPDAYHCLPLDPRTDGVRVLVGMLIVTVLIVVFTLVFNVAMYWQATEDLDRALHKIEDTKVSLRVGPDVSPSFRSGVRWGPT